MIPLRRICPLALPLLAATFGPAWAERGRSLDIVIWPEYIDPGVVEAFEAEFDADVRFSYFDSDEQRDKELTASGATGADVILVNNLQMARYVKRGWIAPLPLEAMPNLAHIASRWTRAMDGAASGFGAAYFWGTLGIAWRSDLYPAGFSSWDDLLEPAPALSGRILMNSSSRELVGFALKADGHSANTVDRGLIRTAGRKLARQKPFVRGYGYPSLTEASSLVTGEVWASPLYSGDALVLQAFEPALEFRLPDEGGLLWVDYLTVARSSERHDLATAFIDFVNRPAIAARNAEHVSFATPNEAALELVSAEYLADPVIHPSGAHLRGSEFLRPLPARSTKSVNTVMSELLIDQ